MVAFGGVICGSVVGVVDGGGDGDGGPRLRTAIGDVVSVVSGWLKVDDVLKTSNKRVFIV